MSDGTSTLRFLETTRFQEKRKLKVADGVVAIDRLNELEMVRGEIWANVWETDYIVRISPKEGRFSAGSISRASSVHPTSSSGRKPSSTVLHSTRRRIESS